MPAPKAGDLLAAILGDYQPGRGIRVFYGLSAAHDTDLTEAHELVHLHLCTISPFGRFQQFLGEMVSHPETPAQFHDAGQKALRASIEHSWRTHEGAATLTEHVMATLKGGKQAFHEFDSKLPEDYRSAVSALRRAIWTWELPFIFLGTIGEAVAYTALATGILREMRDPEGFLAVDWRSYFSTDPQRAPDARLEAILHQLASGSARDRLQSAVSSCVLTFAPSLEQDDVNAAYLALSLDERKLMGDRIHDSVIAIARSCVPFEVVEGAMVDALHGELWDSWASVLPNMAARGSGEDNPAKRQSGKMETHIEYALAQLDYVSDPRFDSGVFCVAFNQEMQLSVRPHGCEPGKLYVSILQGLEGDWPTDKFNSLFCPPALGATVLIHAVTRGDSGYRYECPLPESAIRAGSPMVRAGAPCAIVCRTGAEITHLLEKFEGCDHVRSVLQRRRDSWESDGYPKALCSMRCSPLVVIVLSSRLEHWKETLQEWSKGHRLWVSYGDDESEESLAPGWLVAGTDDERIVWARPASRMMRIWLRWHLSRTEAIRWADRLPGSVDWRERLAIAFHHHRSFGW